MRTAWTNLRFRRPSSRGTHLELVGRERVIASTDGGLGGRVRPQIAWAKRETLEQIKRSPITLT
jgi:hypothetical protein